MGPESTHSQNSEAAILCLVWVSSLWDVTGNKQGLRGRVGYAGVFRFILDSEFFRLPVPVQLLGGCV